MSVCLFVCFPVCSRGLLTSDIVLGVSIVCPTIGTSNEAVPPLPTLVDISCSPSMALDW